MEDAVRAALTELGMDTSIDHVTDFIQIAAYGVMTTPALVVDGKVVSYGKVLKKEEAKAFDPQYTTNPQGGKGAGVKSLLIPGAKQGVQSGGEEEQADPLGGGQPQENAPVGISTEKFQQEPGRGV